MVSLLILKFYNIKSEPCHHLKVYSLIRLLGIQVFRNSAAVLQSVRILLFKIYETDAF